MNMSSSSARAAPLAALIMVAQLVSAAESPPVAAPAMKSSPPAFSGTELDAILHAITPSPPNPRLPKHHQGAKTGAPEGVVVKRGETLDKIVARELGDLPFRRELLVSAVMQKNPSTFKNQRSRHLVAGTVLLMPGPEDFAHLMPSRLTVASPPRGDSGASHEGAPVADVADPKRSWIRFP